MNGQDVIEVEPTEAPVRGGSRFNAVKHGLYAKTTVLPGEDAQAFQALVEVYREGLQPRNGMQEDLALHAALASWQHGVSKTGERIRRAQGAFNRLLIQNVNTDAEGYSGDVEAGVERFERKFGPQTNERTVERNMLNAVPDYARYTPPGDEQQEISGAGRGRRNGQDGEPNLGWAYEESARRDETEQTRTRGGGGRGRGRRS